MHSPKIIGPSQLVDFGASDDYDVLMAGFRFDDGGVVRDLIIQIETAESELASESMGFCAELDERAFYNGVKSFKYFEVDATVHCLLDSTKIGGTQEFLFSVPESADTAQKEVLRQMSSRHAELVGGKIN